MLTYAIGILPLSSRLRNRELQKQKWFADDSACPAPPWHIIKCLLHLLEIGLLYGYLAELSKALSWSKSSTCKSQRLSSMTYRWKLSLQAAFWVAASVMRQAFNSTSQERLTCGSGVLSSWPELPGPIHSWSMLHSHIFSCASGHTFSRSWMAVRKSIAIFITPSIRSLPQLCSG